MECFCQLGGKVFLNGGGNIRSGADGADGLYAADEGSAITAQNVNIISVGDKAHGIHATKLATITYVGGSIETQGNKTQAVFAEQGAHIIFDGGKIRTSGEFANGFNSFDQGTTIESSNAQITTTGFNSIGVFTERESNVTFSNGSVTTSGDEAHALAVEDENSTLNVSATNVQTSGASANGLGAARGGRATLSNSTINTSGENSHGIAVLENGTIDIQNTAIRTSGNDSAAIYAGHFANGADEDIAKANSVSVTGGSILAENGDVIRAQGVPLNVNFKNIAKVDAKSGNLLRAMNDDSGRHSIVAFTATNSDMTGTLLVDDQNSANISLFTSRLTGQAINATNFSIDANSIWNITANSTISQALTNNGSIAFQAPTSNDSKTLTTQSYSTNNGTIHFNTVLGDDSSQTDRLIVENNTTGTGNISISNIGGLGAQTVEGIKLIEVNGQSNANFTMINGDTSYNGQQAMVAGAYIYSLYQGGASTSNDGNWYLRNVLIEENPEDPVVPTPPTNPDTSNPLKTVYQPGVPIYEAYPQSLIALNTLPTLQQRVGNRNWVSSRATDNLSVGVNSAFASDTTGFWLRMEGGYNKIEPKHSTTNTKFNQNIFRMQAGLDAGIIENSNHTLIAGVNVQYTRGKANSDWRWSDFNGYGDGKITTDGYGFGGTLTWYNHASFYIDSQAQLTWYNSDLNSNLDHKNLVTSNQGFGYALSAEAGKKFDIGNDLYLTPQAQLIYSEIDFKSFSDRFNAKIRLKSADSLQSRMGLAFERERSFKNHNGSMNRSFIYGIANIYYEFLDGSEINVSGAKFMSHLDKWSGGMGLGGSYNFADDKYSFYGEASVNTSLPNFGDSYSLKGNIGFRSKF